MEPVERVMEKAREMREEHADMESLPFFINVWRNEWLVARIIIPPDRDTALRVAYMSAYGFGANEIVLIIDTYTATEKWWDDRKRLPKPGELQRTFEKGRLDLVSEALAVHWANRAGDCWAAVQPYLNGPDGFVWDEVNVFGGPKLGGDIASALREAFKKNELFETMADMGVSIDDFDLTPSEARVHADCALTKFLAEHNVAVALFPDSEEAAEIMKISFEETEGENFEVRYIKPDE
jgi:hypothetical protein